MIIMAFYIVTINCFHVLVRWINQTENIRDVYGMTIFVKIKISRCWKNNDF